MRCKKIKIKGGNARYSRSIAKFSSAFAPARTPRQRPAGDKDMGLFALKLVGRVLIRGPLDDCSDEESVVKRPPVYRLHLR